MAAVAVEIQSMLVLSTGHVTEDTGKALDAARTKTPGIYWTPQMSWDYGWVFYVDDGTFSSADFPPEFEAIFALAVKLGVAWVRFDCDGPQIEDLPFYEW